MYKKSVSVILAFVLLLSMMQVSAFASSDISSAEIGEENSNPEIHTSADISIEQIDCDVLPTEVLEQESDFAPAALEEMSEPYTPVTISLNNDRTVLNLTENEPIVGTYEIFILENGKRVFYFNSGSNAEIDRDTILKENTEYFISVVITADSSIEYYDGYFNIIDSTLEYEYIYHSSVMTTQNNDISLLAGTQRETESNNTYSAANTLIEGNTMLGCISNVSDHDWYKISFAKDGNATFSLANIPNGTDYNMTIYSATSTYSTPTVLHKCINSGSVNENWKMIVDSDLYYYVEVFSFTGYSSTSNYYLNVTNTPITDQYEVNDTTAKATTISTNGTYYANLHNTKDVDYYKLTLSSSGRVTINLANIPAGNNYDLELYNSSNTKLASSNKLGSTTENISQSLQSGIYYIKVFSVSGSSYTNNYQLSVVTISNSITVNCTIKPKIPENAGAYSGIETAIKDLPVKLYTVSSLNRTTLISEGTTNSSGTYSKSGVNVSGDVQSIRIMVVFDNSTLCVKKTNGEIYSFGYDIPLGSSTSISVTLPNQTTVPEEQILAYAIWKNGLECISKHNSISNVYLGKLEFRSSVGSTGSSCTNSILGNYISLDGQSTNKDYLDKDVILHEMGHWMMYKQGLMPINAGGNHGYATPCSTAGAAYAEGWATLYSCAARNSAQMMDYFSLSSSNYGANLSNAQYYSSGWKNLALRPTPAENQMYELNVGAVLWAYKNNNSYYATQALTSPRKNSLEDVYNAAISAAATSTAKEAIWGMFNDRGCAFDTTVPTVSLSVAGTTALANANDEVAIKQLAWYVNGEQVKVSDSATDTLDLTNYPGIVTIEARAYDPEGLENRTWLRNKRCASETKVAYIYSPEADLLESYSSTVDGLNSNEITQDGGSIGTISVDDVENYTLNTNGSRDIYIYSSIIGGIHGINIYDPNGSLFESVAYISPDNPYIIENAEPGLWTVEVVGLSEGEIDDILNAADIPMFEQANLESNSTVADEAGTDSSFDEVIMEELPINKEEKDSFILPDFDETLESGSIDDGLSESYADTDTSENIATAIIASQNPEENDNIFEELDVLDESNDVLTSQESMELGSHVAEPESSGEERTWEDIDITGESNSDITLDQATVQAENIINENLNEEIEVKTDRIMTYDEFVDKIKNQFTTSVAIKLFTKPSKVNCDNVVYTANPMYLAELYSHEEGVIVQCDGISLDYTQPLNDGYYELELFRGLDGLTSDISYMTMIVDTVAPEVEFINDFETYEDGIYLNGICSSDTSKVMLGGVELSLSEFVEEPSFGVYLEMEIGVLEKELTIIDQCGNISTEHLVMTRCA